MIIRIKAQFHSETAITGRSSVPEGGRKVSARLLSLVVGPFPARNSYDDSEHFLTSNVLVVVKHLNTISKLACVLLAQSYTDLHHLRGPKLILST